MPWLVRLSVLVVIIAGIHGSCFAATDPMPPSAREPLVVLTGPDSKIKEPTYLLVKTPEDWAALWRRHKGKEDQVGFRDMPTINFEKCMVVAVFRGQVGNEDGLLALPISEREDEIRVHYWWRNFQTEGFGVESTPYGMIVIPRSNKTIVVEEQTNGMGRPDPQPKYTERARFPK